MKRSTSSTIFVACAASLLAFSGCAGGGASPGGGTPPGGSAPPAGQNASQPSDGIHSFEGTYTQKLIGADDKANPIVLENPEGNARAQVTCSGGVCTLDEIAIDTGSGRGFFLSENPVILEDTVSYALKPEDPPCAFTRPDFPQGLEVTGSFSADRLTLQIESPMIMPLDANGGVICYSMGESTSFDGKRR